MKHPYFYLLLLATMLLTLSTNVDAQTKRTQTRKTTTTAKPKQQMVDMGLTVKWSNIDLGATTTQSAGSQYLVSEDVAKACGEGWRLPTLVEFKELLDNTNKLIVENNGKPSCIKLTSKKNGAILYFYFPKSIMSDDGSIQTNPAKKGGNTIYACNMHLQPGKLSGSKHLQRLGVADFRSSKSQIQSELNKLGVTNMKFSEWPQEMADQMTNAIGQNSFFSDYLDWLGTAYSDNVYSDSDIKATIRPVYSLNDDE